MFGIFNGDKKDLKITDALTGMASVFREDLDMLLMHHRFSTGVDILKVFSLPVAIVSYHLLTHFDERRRQKIVAGVEQEAFNYLFATHLRHKINDPAAAREARDDFHRQVAQFLVGVPNLLSKNSSIPEISRIIQNNNLLDQVSYCLMHVCVVNPSYSDEEYLKIKYKMLSIMLERFQINVQMFLNSHR